jgi:hypothetical protein
MPESKRFLLRLDPRLFEALRRWADEDLRSINAQIEYLLTDQARRAGRLPHRQSKAQLPDAPAPDDDEPVSATRRASSARAVTTRREASRHAS